MTRNLSNGVLEFVSIHVFSALQISLSMSNEEFGVWAKKALVDMQLGCVSADVDERVKAAYEDSKNMLQKSKDRRRAAYEKRKKNSEEKAEEVVKLPAECIYGKFANVYLTQDEYNSLLTDIGNFNEMKDMIENLSAKLEDGNVKSDNHFATLTSWIQYRKKKEAESEQPRVFKDRNMEILENSINYIKGKYGTQG